MASLLPINGITECVKIVFQFTIFEHYCQVFFRSDLEESVIVADYCFLLLSEKATSGKSQITTFWSSVAS